MKVAKRAKGRDGCEVIGKKAAVGNCAARADRRPAPLGGATPRAAAGGRGDGGGPVGRSRPLCSPLLGPSHSQSLARPRPLARVPAAARTRAAAAAMAARDGTIPSSGRGGAGGAAGTRTRMGGGARLWWVLLLGLALVAGAGGRIAGAAAQAPGPPVITCGACSFTVAADDPDGTGVLSDGRQAGMLPRSLSRSMPAVAPCCCCTVAHGERGVSFMSRRSCSVTRAPSSRATRTRSLSIGSLPACAAD